MDKTTYTDRYDNEISKEKMIELTDIASDKAVWLEIYKAVISRIPPQYQGSNMERKIDEAVKLSDYAFDAFKERWAE